jgi:LEA14-like dessication related protein
MKLNVNRLKLLLGFIVILTAVACNNIEQPELKGIQEINIQQFGTREIKIDASIIVYNHNKQALKIRSALFDVIVQDEIIGKLTLNEPVELKANIETPCPCTLTIDSKAGMQLGFKSIKKITSGELKIRLKGSIIGRIGILHKKLLVDEEL